eukprot:TRINITY_DN6555_c0_g3_i1.p3 TRINITY_DN6555_c0_g3~~TRINITY_DN6555_c0_g3_i1.p3  ORF type:complete len:399 (+),score=119.77 TRINITY_DN6555_c0_g3_i1:1418-2614(+)
MAVEGYSHEVAEENECGEGEPVPQRNEAGVASGIAGATQRKPQRTRSARGKPRGFREWEAKVQGRAREQREMGRFGVPIYCSTGWRKLYMKERCHLPPPPMRPAQMFSPAVGSPAAARAAPARPTPTPRPPSSACSYHQRPPRPRQEDHGAEFDPEPGAADAAVEGGDEELGIPPRAVHRTTPIPMQVENEARQWKAARRPLRQAASLAAKILAAHHRPAPGPAEREIDLGDEDAEGAFEFSPEPPEPAATPPFRPRPATAMGSRMHASVTDPGSGFGTTLHLPYATRPHPNSVRHVRGPSRAKKSTRDPFTTPSVSAATARPASAPLFRNEYNLRSAAAPPPYGSGAGKQGEYAPPSALCRHCKLPLFGAMVCRVTGQFHYSNEGVRLHPSGDDDEG